MTKEQFDHLRKVLDLGTTSVLKNKLKSSSNPSRSRRVQAEAEVSLGTVLRRNDYSGPTDWRG